MTFHDLHHHERPLILPNAWDVPSALTFVDAGFTAIGTTSFGLAASRGRPDGVRASKDANLVLAAALRGLPTYLTVDIEDGYSDDHDTVAGYVAQLADAGAVGVNIEDSSDDRLLRPELHARKVAAVKERNPSLFVNARVDTYWLHQDATVEQTVERAVAYAAAGADGVFVPGVSDLSGVAEIAKAVPVPLNVLAIPEVPVARLAELGVRRISTGSLPYRAAMHAAAQVAEGIRDGRAVPPAITYAVLQRRLVDYSGRWQADSSAAGHCLSRWPA